MKSSKLKIFVPTSQEAEHIARSLPAGSELIISGVGMVRTAAAVVSAAAKDTLFIMAGIAGAYPHSGLLPGDCVVVGIERVADQGAFRDGGFVELYNATYHSPLADSIKTIPVVRSNSVNAGASSYIDTGADYVGGQALEIENMEGAAFFAVCQALDIPFIEIRAVSNLTTDDRSAWQLDKAIRALDEGLKKLLNEIEG